MCTERAEGADRGLDRGEARHVGLMTREPKTIEVKPGSELDQLLEEASGKSLVLVRNGVRYRLDREDKDPWADYDPEKVRAGMRAAAGRWTGMDAETFREYVYRGREEGTRPPDRPLNLWLSAIDRSKP